MKSQYRMLFTFIVLLVAVSLACGGGSTPAAPTAAPTNPPPPTSEAAPTSNVPQPSSNEQPSTNGTSSDLVTFVDQNNLLAFDLPGDWFYENIPSDDNVFYTDVFTSPDESAKIESLVYNDDEAFVKNQNGKFALYLLNTYYSSTGNVGDIRVASDQIMDDGSERLEWSSKGGGYSGVSFFELRGNDNKTFLMLTAWWVDGTDDAVLDAVNNAISSYYIP